MVSKKVVTFRKSFRFSSLAAALALALGVAGGCSLLTKTDRSKIDESGGAAGSGGTGGETTTAAPGGGGSGGSTICTSECCSASDCPLPDNECVQRACEAGVCGTKAVPNGVPVSTQTPGDCQTIVCDGTGASKTVAAAADLPVDGNDCTLDKCVAGVPKNTDAPAGEACAQNGGKKCDGSGTCVECLAPSECDSNVCTVAGDCAPPQCGDDVKNGDETDTDCGGACGATCVPGEGCAGAGDCIEHVCDAMTGKCAPPQCTDGVKNGDETDMDCGGACGATCGPDEGCKKNGDCKGNSCSGSFCLPSCTDGVHNYSETGIDCGGPNCDAPCTSGTPCTVPSDCSTAYCIDAVCCATSCAESCAACSAAKKVSGPDGECGPALPGTDPHNTCDLTPPTICGTGLCDGTGKCETWPVGTLCGDPAACGNGIQINPDMCDDAGVCKDSGTTPCGLYACGATACNTTCAGDADCGDTAYCLNTDCVAKKADTAACAGNNECASGFCADGLCCNEACSGACKACSAAAGGSVDGTCTPVAAGQDPAGDCGGTGLCDGAGACKSSVGQPCSQPVDCLTGSCADGFCCDTPCAGVCEACSNLKKGAGANGTCEPIGVGLDPDDECPGAAACDGNQACIP